MDSIDRQIVHCLSLDGRATFDLIGEVVGVSAQTVARRYRVLREVEALRVTVVCEDAAVGKQTWFSRIVCRPGTTENVAVALTERRDATWVSIVSGGSEIICAIESDEHPDRGAMLLEQLPHVAQVLRFDAFAVLHEFHGPDAAWSAIGSDLTAQQCAQLTRAIDIPEHDQPEFVALGAEDAPLLDALASDGRAALKSLATSTGWTAARTARRMREILGSGAARIEVELNPRAFGFAASAFIWMNVVPQDLDRIGASIAAHPEAGFVAAITGRSNLVAAVTCRNSSDLYRYLTSRLGRLPGIRATDLTPVLRRLKAG